LNFFANNVNVLKLINGLLAAKVRRSPLKSKKKNEEKLKA